LATGFGFAETTLGFAAALGFATALGCGAAFFATLRLTATAAFLAPLLALTVFDLPARFAGADLRAADFFFEAIDETP